MKSEDQIVCAIGNWGSWQRRYIVLLGLVVAISGHPILVIPFLSADTDFACSHYRPFSSSSSTDTRCGNISHECTAWTFDRSTFTNTIIQEFQLVCNRSTYVDHAQSVFFLGLTLGIIIVGYTSDRFGRKVSIVSLTLCIALLGVGTAFVQSIEAFIALRFFHGVVTVGAYLVPYVWCVEVVGGKWKTIVGVGMAFFWAAGWLILSLETYLVTDWKILLLITNIPAAPIGFAVWALLPESPRWLLTKKRYKKAEKIIREAVVVNKINLPVHWKLLPVSEKPVDLHPTPLKLFCSPALLAKTLILAINWFANSLAYFGLTLNSFRLGGTVRLNFLAAGLLEIPAYAFSLWLLLHRGRKCPYLAILFVAGLCLLLTIAVPVDRFHKNWPAMTLALMGKLCVTGTFQILYVFSGEIFPTVVRGGSVGLCSMFARVGGIVAPYLANIGGPAAVPIVIFGSITLFAMVCATALPETVKRKMPDTLSEGEKVKCDFFEGFNGEFPAGTTTEESVYSIKPTILTVDIVQSTLAP